MQTRNRLDRIKRIRNKMKLMNAKKVKMNHHELFGSSPIRGIIYGRSGSGKTQALVEIFLSLIDFENLVVLTKKSSLPLPGNQYPQDAYIMLFEEAEEMKKKIHIYSVDDDDTSYEKEEEEEEYDIGNFTDFQAMVQKNSYPKKSLVIIDDLDKKQLTEISNIVNASRHAGANIFILTQSVTMMPNSLKTNANFVIMFSGTSTYSNFYSDMANNLGVDKLEFKSKYNSLKPWGFLFIDKQKHIIYNRNEIEVLKQKVEELEKGTKFWVTLANNRWMAIFIFSVLYMFSIKEIRDLIFNLFGIVQ